ncbi:MAG TPA: protein kinase, partial [Candidatus Krumholzibacteria bacterium]|nr:protein kinase [Candidatus Krumholzibacteria bacterium]
MIGSRLAHYEVKTLLGKGGMGEVYRAADTRLGRDVALKVLPAEVAGDPERLARFEREARLLAALQHPDIAAVYGLESDAGHTFLVMELCEGENLAERLARGALPVDEVMQVAGHLAAGLAEAHEKGIVHRDLKPANIMLGPDGRVKILDFGLARAFGEGGPDGGVENSPTLTAAFTSPGVILGTAAYMSPEQARGKTVDKRADIWAFGVIVREMLTGERLFAGETVSDTLAAVLTRDIEPGTLPGSTPPALRHVLFRCLQRDPARRLRDIGEARVLLADPDASSILSASQLAKAYEPARRLRPLALAPWVLLAVVLAVALPRLLGGGKPAAPAPLRRFTLEAALPRLYNTRAVEISPDGRRIAVYARDGLWVRDLDNVEPRLLVAPEQLTHNEVGITPFWSPDNEWIAYGSQGRLWKVPVAGGTPQVVCTLPGDWMGGAWSDDGTIVFGTGRGPMYSVPARGGDATVLLPLVPDVELDFHQPSYVADGGGFVYAVHRDKGVDTIELLRGGERRQLLRVEVANVDDPQVVNNPVYSRTGHIVYQRDQGNRGLWALPFDAKRGVATGAPFLISSVRGHPSVSLDGTLVSTAINSVAKRRLEIVGRDGAVRRVLTEPATGTSQPRFSPDGRRIAFVQNNGQATDVFVLDLGSGLANRLTLTEGRDTGPTWTPDGRGIAYASPSGECLGVWVMDADGGGQPRLLTPSGYQPEFTRDGRDLVFTTMCMKERGLM